MLSDFETTYKLDWHGEMMPLQGERNYTNPQHWAGVPNAGG